MPGSHRVAIWVLAGLLALSATACQSGAGEVDVPISTSRTSAAAPSAPLAPPPTTEVAAADDLNFTTPTGNIRCNAGGTAAAETDYLDCTISDARWQSPPLPAGECPPGFGEPYSRRIGLGATAVAGFDYCSTDAVVGGETLAGYGRPLQVGRFYCVARESALRCENTDTGHGFELSQATYEFF